MPAQPARKRPPSAASPAPSPARWDPWRARGLGAPWLSVALAPRLCQSPGRQRTGFLFISWWRLQGSGISQRVHVQGADRPGRGMTAVFGLNLGPGDDREVQPSPGGELGSRQTRRGQIPQEKLPPHPRPRFHPAAAAAARRPRPDSLGLCLPHGPFRPGLAREAAGRSSHCRAPPGKRARHVQVTNLKCKGPSESGAKPLALRA